MYIYYYNYKNGTIYCDYLWCTGISEEARAGVGKEGKSGWEWDGVSGKGEREGAWGREVKVEGRWVGRSE